MTDQKYTKELEAFEDALKERWCQLKGYFDHPRLDKPKALYDECPECHVDLKLFFDDCKKHMEFQLEKVTKQRDELREALENFLEDYVKCANSGDWGNWDPEEQKEVIAARKALALTKTKESV